MARATKQNATWCKRPNPTSKHKVQEQDLRLKTLSTSQVAALQNVLFLETAIIMIRTSVLFRFLIAGANNHQSRLQLRRRCFFSPPPLSEYAGHATRTPKWIGPPNATAVRQEVKAAKALQNPAAHGKNSLASSSYSILSVSRGWAGKKQQVDYFKATLLVVALPPKRHYSAATPPPH